MADEFRRKKARSCNECFSSRYEPNYGYSCILGFTVDAYKGVPLEPCARPRSRVEFWKWAESYRKEWKHTWEET